MSSEITKTQNKVGVEYDIMNIIQEHGPDFFKLAKALST